MITGASSSVQTPPCSSVLPTDWRQVSQPGLLIYHNHPADVGIPLPSSLKIHNEKKSFKSSTILLIHSMATLVLSTLAVYFQGVCYPKQSLDNDPNSV